MLGRCCAVRPLCRRGSDDTSARPPEGGMVACTLAGATSERMTAAATPLNGSLISEALSCGRVETLGYLPPVTPAPPMLPAPGPSMSAVAGCRSSSEARDTAGWSQLLPDPLTGKPASSGEQVSLRKRTAQRAGSVGAHCLGFGSTALSRAELRYQTDSSEVPGAVAFIAGKWLT
jgi:hypothetical protein